MTFVHPLFLWALLAVAIPVIIHLFNFRKYKKVYFTNVKFLRELQEETKSHSRLKELLILACRVLAIAALVFAFAQPFIPGQNNSNVQAGNSAISLYIDNSFSTQNVNSQGPVFEIAKQRAKEVVKAYSSADRFQILTNDFEGRHQRLLTREDALNAIDELKISSGVRLLSDVLKRQTEFLAGSAAPNKRVYIFSDAQQSTFNIKDLKPDSNLITSIVPLNANEVNNIFIDSCWFESPLQQKGFIQKLHARIVNNGNSKIEIGSAKLFINKQQTALASFSLDANSETEVKFTFECKQNGFHFGSIKLEDYPVTFDDELFFAFNSEVNVEVGLINGKKIEGSNAFAALFKSDSIFKFNECSEQMVDYSWFKTSNVLVLNQLSEISSGLLSELIKFSNQGGAVVIIPSGAINQDLYNKALGQLKLPLLGATDSSILKTGKPDEASGFYVGVFDKIEDRMNLPQINEHYKLLINNQLDFEGILKLQNNDVFLGKSELSNASVYLFASPLNDKTGNFSRHALFVPTVYRICLGALKQLPLFYQTGLNQMIVLKSAVTNANGQPPHLVNTDSTLDLIPETRIVNTAQQLFTRNQVNQPGFYSVKNNAQYVLPLAFNYSRRESDLKSYTPAELTEIISGKGFKKFSLIDESDRDISKQVMQNEGGKKLWKLFIILTLCFIIIETALLRLLK